MPDGRTEFLNTRQVQAAFGDACIIVVDEVSDAIDIGSHIIIGIYADGKLLKVLAYEPARYYEALRRVMETSLPSLQREYLA